MEPAGTGDVRADLDALVDLAWGDGGRHAMRAYLYDRLARLGAARYESRHAVAADDHVIAVLPSCEPDRRPLVLTARTDLSGVSALASVAAVLAAVPGLIACRLERAVLVALFDESPPPWPRAEASRGSRPSGHGAQAWFEDGLGHDVKAALVIGRLVPGPRVAEDDVLVIAGIETDARLPPLLTDAAPPGCRLVPTRHLADGLPFDGHRIPYLRVGAPALGPTRGRRVDVAAAVRLAAHAAHFVVTLATRLDDARLPGPYGGFDSTAFELEAAQRALGPVLDEWGGAPTGRDDLDRLTARIHEA
jgi:hypothetical protein